MFTSNCKNAGAEKRLSYIEVTRVAVVVMVIVTRVVMLGSGRC